jgi:hypothetical protein
VLLLVELLVVPLLVLVELLVEPLLLVPASGRQGPQVPMALPVAVMQVSPEQQSALMVHLPQVGTHPVAPQT